MSWNRNRTLFPNLHKSSSPFFTDSPEIKDFERQSTILDRHYKYGTSYQDSLVYLGIDGPYITGSSEAIRLFVHQVIGIAWVVTRWESIFPACIIADLMGLGKILQGNVVLAMGTTSSIPISS